MRAEPRLRLAPGIAWSIPILVFAAYLLATWLDQGVNPKGPGESTHWADAFWSAAYLGFPVVGAIIVSRLPRNVIGWLLCAIGVGVELAVFASEYSQYSLVTSDGAMPGGTFFGWLTSWSALVAAGSLVTLLIVFPTGSPRNRFWRWVVAWVAIATSALIFLYATRPGPLDSLREIDNPVGIEVMKGFAAGVIPFLGGSLALAMVAAIGDKIWVLTRSTGIERQQIKSFALAALVFPTLFAVAILLEGFIGIEGNKGEFDPVVLAFFFGFNGLAAAVGVAVFKHRLYEIDLVINRTLVYGLLTAILAGAYVGLVFGFQLVLSPVTNESDLAIAASTLAVAALFRPVRTRVQAFIDRRFYRRKFDKERTIEEFSSHLRDEVDLGQLSSQLVSVVTDTMQPAHVSLWLRPEATR